MPGLRFFQLFPVPPCRSPRKLNIQNRLERAVVPTPSAARGTTPREEIKAVSTRAVIGSAVRESRTGIESPSRVR